MELLAATVCSEGSVSRVDERRTRAAQLAAFPCERPMGGKPGYLGRAAAVNRGGERLISPCGS